MENQSAQTNPPAVGSSSNISPNPVQVTAPVVAPVTNTVATPFSTPAATSSTTPTQSVASSMPVVTPAASPTPTTVMTQPAPVVMSPPASITAPTPASATGAPTTAAPTNAATVSGAVMTGNIAAPKITQPTNPTTGNVAGGTISSTGGTISASQTAAIQNSATKVSEHATVSYPWYQFYKSPAGVQKALIIAVLVLGFVIFTYAGYFIGNTVGRASVPVTPAVNYSTKSSTPMPSPTMIQTPLIMDSTDSAEINEATKSGLLDVMESADSTPSASTESAAPANRPSMR